MVLLVIDTQKLITNENLYNFVRHDDGPNEELTKGTEGFEIYEKFQPKGQEKIFDKHVNSAFKESGLLQYLKYKEEKYIFS